MYNLSPRFQRLRSSTTVVQLREADDKQGAAALVKIDVISQRIADVLARLVIPQLQFAEPKDNVGWPVVGNYGTLSRRSRRSCRRCVRRRGNLRFGLEPEWAAVVLLALVYSGEITLALPGVKMDAGNLDETIRAGATSTGRSPARKQTRCASRWSGECGELSF